jgi:heme-degrading monooxygenase HmoA
LNQTAAESNNVGTAGSYQRSAGSFGGSSGAAGKRNPYAYIEQRQQRLYRRQLEGLSARQLVLDHADREGVSVATAWRDWEAVNAWNSEDWDRDRQNMLARLQTMRTKLFNAAIRKGQLQTAAQILDSLGKVVNEAGVEQQAASAPQLFISIDDKRNG